VTLLIRRVAHLANARPQKDLARRAQLESARLSLLKMEIDEF